MTKNNENNPRIVVSVKNLSHIFSSRTGEIKALEDISIEAQEGELITLVGPSGCGKSTILLIIGGLLECQEGEVCLYDMPVQKPNPELVGFVFQEASLFPWKNAIENVEFPLRIRGSSKEQRKCKAKELLDMVGLGDFSDKYPYELSGGMQQRVAMARGLIQNPQVMLLDEPFASLDEQTRTRLGFELLRIWSQMKKTMIFVTHSLTEAVLLSQRVIVLSARPGRIIDDIAIDIEYPRTYETMTLERFAMLRDRIRQLIAETEVSV